jgi:hypothetical protein
MSVVARPAIWGLLGRMEAEAHRTLKGTTKV